MEPLQLARIRDDSERRGFSALAYAVGSVIRFNIRNAEPALADNPSEATLSLERSSDLALVRLTGGTRFEPA